MLDLVRSHPQADPVYNQVASVNERLFTVSSRGERPSFLLLGSDGRFYVWGVCGKEIFRRDRVQQALDHFYSM